MSQVTRCPACTTLFRIVPDQLRISDGWVRCGRCAEVFDASQQLMTLSETALAAAAAAIAGSRAAPAGEDAAQAERNLVRQSPAATASGTAQPTVIVAPSGLESKAAALPPPAHWLHPDALEDGRARAAAEQPVQGRHAPGAAPERSAVVRRVVQPPHGDAWPVLPDDTEGPPSVPPYYRSAGTGAAAAPAPTERPDPDRPPGFVSTRRDDADADDAAPVADDEVFAAAGERRDPVAVQTTRAERRAARRAARAAHAERAAIRQALRQGSATSALPAAPPLALTPEDPAPPPASLPAGGPQDPADVLGAAEEAEAPVHDVSFVRQGQRRAFWRRPGVRAMLTVFSLACALALAAQWSLQERDAIAAAVPRAGPLLDAACMPLRCRVEPRRLIEAVLIESSSFNRLRSDVYQLRLALRNNAATAIATPALELTLTDANDQPVVRRVLLPRDLGATPLLAAGGQWAGNWTVSHGASSPSPRIAGYRLLAFYP